MKYLDLFSGYGGFALGIQQAYESLQDLSDPAEYEYEAENSDNLQGRMESDAKARLGNPVCVGFSEIDKYAIQVYKKHFNHKEYGDITKLDPATLPDFDLLCGGFPCQAFSIAGKRAGFEDTRGTLIYDVFRIIKEKHPKLVLLENVKGLLSHDNGRTFKTIITSFAELGYAVEWQVLNAKNFGVPQNRERVFIIGHLGGFGGRQIFPIGSDNPEDNEIRERTPQVASTINATYSRNQSDAQYVADFRNDEGLRIRKDFISPTLSTRKHSETDVSTMPHMIGNGAKIRRLTPTECCRLMGIPDDWLDGVSDSQKYKLAGNGVVVPVVKEIIKRLI